MKENALHKTSSIICIISFCEMTKLKFSLNSSKRNLFDEFPTNNSLLQIIIIRITLLSIVIAVDVLIVY